MKKRNHLISVVLASLMVYNCVSFRGSNIPKVKLEEIKPEPQKISIDYKIDSKTELAGSMKPLEKKISETLEETLKKSNLFNEVVYGEGKKKIHFDILIEYTLNNKIISFLSSLACFLSLGTIPGYLGTGVYTFKIDVKGNGKFYKTYTYKGAELINWGWILFILARPFTSSAHEEKRLIKRVFLKLIKDMQKDAFFKRAASL